MSSKKLTINAKKHPKNFYKIIFVCYYKYFFFEKIRLKSNTEYKYFQLNVKIWNIN